MPSFACGKADSNNTVAHNGLLDFDITDLVPFSTTQVKIYLPDSYNIPSDIGIYVIKAGSYIETNDFSVSGNIITINITDGGVLDSDGMGDGTIKIRGLGIFERKPDNPL